MPFPSCSCLQLFHGSTYIGEDGTVKSGGGRVMCVTATGSTLQEAQQKSYQAGVLGTCLYTTLFNSTACPLHKDTALKSCRLQLQSQSNFGTICLFAGSR